MPSTDAMVYDDALARQHLRYLGRAGLTAVIAAPHRLADGLAWRLATGAVVEKLIRSVHRFVSARLASAPARRTLLVTYMDQAGTPYESRTTRGLLALQGVGLDAGAQAQRMRAAARGRSGKPGPDPRGPADQPFAAC